MEDKFIVKTEIFEGPLDLLLSLIEKRKLLINEISLSQVTDDFINYINLANKENLQNIAHFILIASTLLLIKSKSLLPTLELTNEEQTDIKDLELRLKIYKRIKEEEGGILNLFGKKSSFFKDQNQKIDKVIFSPKGINLKVIKESINNLINNLPKIEIKPKVLVKKVISLEETINKLTERIKSNISMSFREFSNFGKEEKINVIVSFLAMLELVKQGVLEVEQNEKYGDINLHTKDISVPNYN